MGREATELEWTGRCLLSRENSYVNWTQQSLSKTPAITGLLGCRNGRSERCFSSSFGAVWTSAISQRLLKDGSLLTVLWGGPVYSKGGPWLSHEDKFSMGILGSWPFLCFTASWLACGEQVYSWLCSVFLPRRIYHLGPAPEQHGQSAAEGNVWSWEPK